METTGQKVSKTKTSKGKTPKQNLSKKNKSKNKLSKKRNSQKGKSNVKPHDSLFKWMITSFLEEFFAHYFPHVKIGKYELLDKEFIQKYGTLKESMRGDLLLCMEIEIDGNLREVVIQIENQSTRKDITERTYEYSLYAWRMAAPLLRRKPVWSILIYTDDAYWKKDISHKFCYGIHSQLGEQWAEFDLIKMNREKSQDLLQKRSMLCKLLALKADDRGLDRKEIIREIRRASLEMGISSPMSRSF